MKFYDEVRISVKAGDGGNGCASFRREKFIARGGPNGGDGGKGGDIVLIVDPSVATLIDLHFQKNYRAQDGEHGRGKDQYGKAGGDLIIKVPPGTVVSGEDTGEPLGELIEPGAVMIAAAGGRGGWGNIHFKNSVRQAPDFAHSGKPGEQKTLRLTLKLLADVGIIGYPNAGKSTLISRVSRARPKIADYPFTTLAPNLGVVYLGEHRSFVIADIPGLIKGASEGAGLGHRFLKHVERCAVLIHLLEAAPDPERNPLADFEVIEEELMHYSPDLAAKPRVAALNKIELPECRDWEPRVREYMAARGLAFHAISAVTGEGVQDLMNAVGEVIRQTGSAAARIHGAQIDQTGGEASAKTTAYDPARSGETESG
ncbi:MAG: GTPase Obg [Myxococcota bacterium]|nr:GTPase Obg [Myxococcota bacterium]